MRMLYRDLLQVGAALCVVVSLSPVAASGPKISESCSTADECFREAAWPKERLGNNLTKDQVAGLKLERLRLVMEQYPASVWAKRAGLLLGVMLVERNPAAAQQYLQSAQRDFPMLDDYIRFWMGEALLHLGDAKAAAASFESIPEFVPDSNLHQLVALRAGEAWYQASSCAEAMGWLLKAVSMNEKEPQVPRAWLRLAACYLREDQLIEGREALRQLWVKFPHSSEAKEAEALLLTNLGGEPWAPLPEDHYARAQAFLGLALHGEAIAELKEFLLEDQASSYRGAAKLKLGIAQVRLKLYDQARETFHGLFAEQGAQSPEAAVWLARVFLRQGHGTKLLDLSRRVHNGSLSLEQKGQINLFAGIWLEDQAQFDEAVEKYRLVSKFGDPASQRAEAYWREGWVLYRTGRYREAADVWQRIIGQPESDLGPQALYWTARSLGRISDSKSTDLYTTLYERYPYTYYGQLAREQADVPATPSEQTALADQTALAVVASSGQSEPRDTALLGDQKRNEINQHSAYRRAVELKTLGLEQDAARELTVLADRYQSDPDILMSLSIMLNEAGAYHHALRLARARFRDKLERTGGPVSPELWKVAYPTGLIPMIQSEGTHAVDPLLVAAIIREESQYDRHAVSRVGAIGLMQVMPATASAVAQRHRLPAVSRDDLFDQETNIRIGARYVEQLLGQFAGNVVMTIAAYNAGPIVVGSWSAAHRGRSEDEFVELIPFQETRQYVKRVLRSYKEYRRLTQNPVP
ncbi:MAG: transglycosylase SLT domain-containing protein [Nitrospiraceae bacterium]|nr:transglycosylase SLT domain-containing protein [Nitrospiraceae bacterium]